MATKEEMIARMAELGVSEEDIFKEIVRARYLDYVIFSKRENEEFGLSPAEFLEKAAALTAEEFGDLPEDAERFAHIYTAAMSVDPMLFAEGLAPLSPAFRALLFHAVEQAARAEKTVLFAGAERYLPFLTDIFVNLRNKRIALTVADDEWRHTAQRIYARGRVMAPSEIIADTERYDYIFFAGAADEAAERSLSALRSALREGGVMEFLLPREWFTARPVLSEMAAQMSVERFCHVTDGEAESEYIRLGRAAAAGDITFGEADFSGDAFHFVPRLSMKRADFAAADNWDYDVYAWNGSAGLQAILGAGLLDPDFAVGSVFKEAPRLSGTKGAYPLISEKAVETSGIRAEFVKEAETEDVCRASAGDLLVAATEDGFAAAVVDAKWDGAAVAPGVFALRPVGEYTAEYLKAYLDGPIGQMFLETMRTGRAWHLCHARLLRMPLRRAADERIEAITGAVREASCGLARAEEAWREVLRGAVKLMMG